MGKALKITSIEELKTASQGELVQLPPFSNGTEFVARLRRPSMLNLVQEGKIPNELLVSASSIFLSNEQTPQNKNKMYLKEMGEVLNTMAEACFVEPTYKEIKDSGVILTDEQYLAVFNYTQGGVKALKSFRDEQKDIDSDKNVNGVQNKA